MAAKLTKRDRVTIRTLRRAEEEERRRVLALFERGMEAGLFWEVASSAASEMRSEYVPAMLYRLWREGRVRDEQLADAVPEVWIHNRSPLAGLGERRWLQMFKTAGFVCRFVERVTSGDEEIPIAYAHLTEIPTEPITVWRGAALAK